MLTSFLRRNKSEKQTESPKLCGMPALKQMRSSKREGSLITKPKTGLSTLSELERLRIVGDEEVKQKSTASYPAAETRQEQDETIPMSITRNYRRPKSPDTSDIRQQLNNIDRVTNVKKTDSIFHEEESTRFIDSKIPEENEDATEPEPVANSSWRMSKGDSGYKSKDEGKKENNSQMTKKNRKKSKFDKPLATTGLHVVKQQRKASRDSVSQSMRALTPRERESIRCLEEVLKNQPDDDEKFDEVFDSESSENDIEEEMKDISGKEYEIDDTEETVDYGYASVNDISRKYSLESLESVGSIIDLVGNLSASSSSQTSHIYNAFGLPQHDVTKPDDVIATDTVFVDNYKFENDHSTVSTIKNESDDVTMEADDVILHLDNVIRSFIIESGNDEVDDVNESHIEKKKEIRSKSHKSRDSTSDGEKERKKRERRKNKDPEKEQERKERRKKRKEEKKAKKEREDSSSTEEAKRREENIAKQVDEISALTQDMIKTAQRETQEDEPIYAQVNKSKKKNNLEDLSIKEISSDFEDFPDPPSPFSNRPDNDITNAKWENSEEESNEPICRSSRVFWAQMDEKQAHTQTPDKSSKFNCTSTPIVSPDERRSSHNALHSTTTNGPTKGPQRPVSDASEYKSKYQPYMSKYSPQSSDRMVVCPSMLHGSSQGLRHIDVDAPKGKVLEVNPEKNQIKEIKLRKQQSVETPVNPPTLPTMYFPKKKPVPVPPVKQNFYRLPAPVTYTPRPGRPISLNLDESGNLATVGSDKSHNIVVKPYSSFRHNKTELTKRGSQVNSKPKPFVITAMKKSIQLY